MLSLICARRLKVGWKFYCGRSTWLNLVVKRDLKLEQIQEVVDSSRLSSLNIKEDHFFPLQHRENLSIAYAYAEGKGVKKTEFEKQFRTISRTI